MKARPLRPISSAVCLVLAIVQIGVPFPRNRCQAAESPSEPVADLALPLPEAAWSDEVKEGQREAAKRLAADLLAAAAKGAKEFTVPPANYRFGDRGVPALRLENRADFVIDATGSAFWFEEPRSRIDRILFKHCRNVTFRGGIMDFDPLPFSQGKILSLDPDAGVLTIGIDPGFPLPDQTWVTPKNIGTIKAMFCGPDGSFRGAPLDWVAKLEPAGGRAYRVLLKGGGVFRESAGVAVGDRMVLPDRSGRFVFVLEECEGMVLENVTVYAAPQMAIVEHGGRGGNVYRHCKVVRRPGTSRLLACSADIFHSAKVQHGPTIDGCEFAYNCDDLTNVHSFFSPVIKDSNSDTASILNVNSADIAPGCELEFYDYKSAQPLGTAKVLEVAPKTDFKQAELDIPAALRAQGYRVVDLPGPYMQAVVAKLDRPLALKRFDLVASSLSGAKSTVMRDNFFHDSAAGSGAHLNCIGGTVERNRIQRTGGPGILVAAEHLFWEGPFARDITISGNDVETTPTLPNLRERFNGLQAAIAVCIRGPGFTYPRTDCFPMSNITITSNQVRETSCNALFVSNVNTAQIKNNVLAPGFYQSAPSFWNDTSKKSFAIFVAYSKNVAIEGNQLQGPAPGVRNLIGAEHASIATAQPLTSLPP